MRQPCETSELPMGKVDRRWKRRCITAQVASSFLVEATTLSIAGGIVGIVLGISASAIISKLADWQTVIGASAVLLAVFFSALVGITFGYYPTRKAAYLDPIEALRYE